MEVKSAVTSDAVLGAGPRSDWDEAFGIEYIWKVSSLANSHDSFKYLDKDIFS